MREVLSIKGRGMTSHQFWYRRERALQVKVAHRARPAIVVGSGNHSVKEVELEPVPGWRPVTVLHFPLRSHAQFEAKIVTGGQAVQNAGRWRERRELYALWQEGGLSDHYAQKVVDDRAVEAGAREGRLMVDERLKRYPAGAPGDRAPAGGTAAGTVEGGAPARTGGALAWPDEPVAVAELRRSCAGRSQARAPRP